MTLYPKGHTMQWRPGIRNRHHRTTGTLAQDWLQYGDVHPRILWPGETEPRKELPECVVPVGPAPGTPIPAGIRNAWTEGGW